ncbi:unnamed protein product [Adineta ricciae]|uniref:DUF4139 domain-containing protein n=1 Tax=Adineta ricciae TaxID=249248 RepID=A0A814ZUD3_ADIRI|nr:unnamed protein product [Adineta ricciae]CAF1248546.1 unnamed protein product [Adineta ricciae]
MATTTDSKTPSHASNVYLFKNGYGMIVKTFEFPSSNDQKQQTIEIMDPPSNAVHGTFWIQPISKQTKITSIRTKKTNKSETKDCYTLGDLIEANVEQDIEILVLDYFTQKKEWMKGKIKSIQRSQNTSSDEIVPVAPPPVLHSQFALSGYAVPTPAAISHLARTGDLVLFETTDHGVMALSLSTIASIRGPTLQTTYQQKVVKNCLSIDYENRSNSVDTGLMKYLTYGLTWAPSYSLVLLSSNDPTVKRLRFSSKAVVLNDIENMNVDNLFCIVGFPNTSKFASVNDPILDTANVATFLQQLQQCESTRSRHSGRLHANYSCMSNSMMTQQVMGGFPGSSDSGPDETTEDTNVDDLHLYEFKNVLLEKQERLVLPIFDVELPYKDVYHCKIESNSTQYSNTSSAENKPYEEVWHSVKFDNATNFVLTTAPVLVTKGQNEQQFVGQDLLTYTPKGSTAFVNLTKALDVRVQLEEKVVNTNTRRFTFLSYNYQTDQIEGKLTIMNYKSEEVTVVINMSLTGKTSNYSPEPKKDIVKATEATANPQHDITWEINLKPKQTLEIRYVRAYNKRV